MDHVEVGGLRIAYRRAGKGQPLVLLHGGVGDSRWWQAELDELSDEFFVVAWDAPGCGGSDDPPETFRLSEYADCLAGFIDAVGLDKPHVLGHSWGGGLALELYGRHPAVPRSLVLAAGYAGWAGSLPADEVDRRLQLALRQADALRDEPLTPDALPGLLSPATPRARIDELSEMMADIRAFGLRVMAKAFAEADLRDVLPRVAVPTLLLYGDADERAPRAVAESLHASIPTSTLVFLSGVGHTLFDDAPEASVAEVRKFLSASAQLT